MLTRLCPPRNRMTRRTFVVTASLALTTGLSLALAPLASAAVSPPSSQPMNNWKAPVLCLDVPNNTAQLEICDGGKSQRWTGTSAFNGFLRNGNGDCLGVEGASTAQGAPVVLTSCVVTANRLWNFYEYSTSADGDPMYRVVNENSGLCLTNDNGGTEPGTHVNQSTCTKDPATLWYWTP